MYALPEQTLDGALRGHRARRSRFAPAHLSHYQLTLEPNTLFAAQPPPLPDDDAARTCRTRVEAALAEAGYEHYEVSAYARDGRRCAHNLNYWTFGDYLGIGAGAHGKITDARRRRSMRTAKVKLPRSYLDRAADAAKRSAPTSPSRRAQLPFEFMLNALRLNDGFSIAEFEQRTGPAARRDRRAARRSARARLARCGRRRALRADRTRPRASSTTSSSCSCRSDARCSNSITIDCPYCGESFETHADLSAGSQHYVEDCAVCCRPIEVRLEVGDDDELVAVRVGTDRD